jgi:7-cyano-7-deazaguanine synthase in queuosine biosynthesis
VEFVTGSTLVGSKNKFQPRDDKGGIRNVWVPIRNRMLLNSDINVNKNLLMLKKVL